MAANPFTVLGNIDTSGGCFTLLEELNTQVVAFTRNYEEQMEVLQQSRDELKQLLDHLQKTLADIDYQIDTLKTDVIKAKCLLSSIPPEIDNLRKEEREIQLRLNEKKGIHQGYMHLYHGIFEPDVCNLKISKLYETIESSETVKLREDIIRFENKLQEYQATIRESDDMQSKYPVIESQIATVSTQLKDKEQEICELSNYFTQNDKRIHVSYLRYALEKCVGIPGYSIQDVEFFEFFCCPDRQKALIRACNLRHQEFLLLRNKKIAAKLKELTPYEYTNFYLCYMETTQFFNIHSTEPYTPFKI